MTPLVAVSLKMYFDRPRTLAYCGELARWARSTPAVAAGEVRVAVLPDFLTLDAALRVLAGTGVRVGAQDLCSEDRGAFTGEVSGADLAALGVACVEVGHAERRTLFGEDEALVAAKTRAALRNGIVPMLCVGEAERGRPEDAAASVLAQVRSAVGEDASADEVWVAYEPWWAIAAAEPAPADYVARVCLRVREGLAGHLPNASLVYGGSAGPGLLTRLGDAVDGLFLGRFAHDPAAFVAVVDEAFSPGRRGARR